MILEGIVVGVHVWVPDKDNAWVHGVVTTVTPKSVDVKTGHGPIRITGKELGLIELCGNNVNDDVENLVDLDELTEGSILHHVKKRYDRDLVYTHVGSILVAVNPFKMLRIYGEEEILKFKRLASTGRAPPHVYGTAALAYDQLVRHKHSQSILISGESGAGKTETTKKVLQFVASIAGQRKPNELGIEQQILQSNPVLEAFGNAKTLRNNNSSRFGKWMEVHMNASVKVVGCRIVNYLLEKSRVVRQATNERNYHVMYMLVAGADQALRQRLHLTTANDYTYLTGGGCLTVDEIDDRAEFQDVLRALEDLNFSSDESDQIFTVLAAILHLGNIDFRDGAIDSSSEVVPSTQQVLEQAGALLKVAGQQLTDSFTQKVVFVGRGSTVTLHLKPDQARDTRDAVAKALYSKMFDWLIQRINASLQKEAPALCLGVLDIFGFEVFQLNSFEQLCINYANEKLQEHFNTIMFATELKMYEAEGVPCDDIQFADNRKCVELVEGRPIGVMALLEEECSLGQGTDQSFLSKMDNIFSSSGSKNCNPYYQKERTRPLDFSIKHFAGPVSYTVTGFLDKNKDALPMGCILLCRSSGLPLVSEWFEDDLASSSDTNNKKKQQIKTLGNQFRSHLASLMQTLSGTEPHFIRCIKPNHAKAPNNFDAPLSLRQLKYAGLFEAIRIRKSGYAYRIPHDQFVLRYALLVPELLCTVYGTKRRYDSKAISLQVFESLTESGVLTERQWKIGRTKTFLKSNVDRSVLEQLRTKLVEQYAVKLQKVARGFTTRCRVHAVRYAKLAEQRRLENEKKKQIHSVIVIQTAYRGYLARGVWSQLKEVGELRKAIQANDEMSLAAALLEFTSRSVISPFVKQEVEAAQRVLRSLKEKRLLLTEISRALQTQQVERLEGLVDRATTLGLDNHVDVLAAKYELEKLQEKRAITTALQTFIQDNTHGLAAVPELLEHAFVLGIDASLIEEAQQTYDYAAPRVRARSQLRTAIRCVDLPSIEAGISELESLNDIGEPFGTLELAGARHMLKLLEFEKELSGSGDDFDRDDYDDDVTGSHDNKWPILSRQVIAICDEISLTTSKAVLRRLRNKLRQITEKPATYARVIRAYKWTSMCALWEICSPSKGLMIETQFYGLQSAQLEESPMIRALAQQGGCILLNKPPQLSQPVEKNDKMSERRTKSRQSLNASSSTDISDTKRWRVNMKSKSSHQDFSPLQQKLRESQEAVQKQRQKLQRQLDRIKRECPIIPAWK